MRAPVPPGRGGTFHPSPATAAASQLTAFTEFCEARTAQRFADHAAFHAFSVAEYRLFWSLFLEWSEPLREGSPEPVCTDERAEFARFFPNLRLNYAENLLRPQPGATDDDTAVVAHHAYRPARVADPRRAARPGPEPGVAPAAHRHPPRGQRGGRSGQQHRGARRAAWRRPRWERCSPPPRRTWASPPSSAASSSCPRRS